MRDERHHSGKIRCARCARELPVEGRLSRGATCPHCGANLHSCVNCSFYSPGRHNDCREPQAERVVDKRAANFCDFFRSREPVSDSPDPGTPGARGSAPAPRGGKEAARDRLDRLFGS